MGSHEREDGHNVVENTTLKRKRSGGRWREEKGEEEGGMREGEEGGERREGDRERERR